MQTPMMSPSLMMPVQMDGFQKGWEQGEKRRREDATRRAMAALVGNPNDPQALANLARQDPKTAMEFRTKNAELEAKGIEAYRDTITTGAEMMQRLTSQGVPKAQAAQMTRQTLIANRFPGANEIPEEMDDQYIDGIMALAKPQGQESALMRDFQGYQGLPPDQQQQMQQFMQMRYPGMQAPVILPHNIAPVGGQQGNLPRVGDAASYEAVPPGGQYIGPDGQVRVKQGGQSGSAPAGNF